MRAHVCRWSLCLTFLVALSAQASVLWKGDYDTGDLSQWGRVDSSVPSRLVVQQSNVHQGTYALQVTVQPGDMSSGGNRNELEEANRPLVEGDERWYHWSTFWPTDYVAPDTWQLFTQWHHSGCCGSPPIAFLVQKDEIRIDLVHEDQTDEELTLEPLVRGVWHDFVAHIKFSSDASVGFVEAWIDGVNVLPLKNWTTLFSGQQDYLKQGLYRDANIGFAQTIFHDGTFEADSRDDVFPPAPAPTTTTTTPTTDPSATNPTPTDPTSTSGTPTDPATSPSTTPTTTTTTTTTSPETAQQRARRTLPDVAWMRAKLVQVFKAPPSAPATAPSPTTNGTATAPVNRASPLPGVRGQGMGCGAAGSAMGGTLTLLSLFGVAWMGSRRKRV